MKQMKIDAFNVAPEDLDWTIRDNCLPKIDLGLTPMKDQFITYLEMDAIRILGREIHADPNTTPDRNNDPDGWRLWWLNEVQYLSHHTGSIPDAKDHLAPQVRHAVNTLTIASRLRDAMDRGDVESVAALAILLSLQAIQGGYSIEHEAAKRIRDKAQHNSIVKINSGYAMVQRAAIRKAADIWKSSPEKRIGEVVKEIHEAISRKAKSEAIDFPVRETVKKWLIEANDAGKLKIPDAARKGGRSKGK